MINADWLIIDWGTTNFRAFAVNQFGETVSKIEKPMGLLQIKTGKFPFVLEGILKDWLEEYKSLPIYMAGMVGSDQGWIKVPYEETPATLSSLVKKSYSFSLPWGAQATVIPGICHKTKNNTYDVMRGEEVQLFGLQSMMSIDSFTAILPGTHSKHAHIEGETIYAFNTYMTGELFSVLSDHSILGMNLPEQEVSESSFKKGVENSNNINLLNEIFSVRTLRIFKEINEKEILEYLSGLLIGYELNSLENENVFIVGSEKLSKKYSDACKYLGVNAEIISGDQAFLHGMKVIKGKLEKILF